MMETIKELRKYTQEALALQKIEDAEKQHEAIYNLVERIFLDGANRAADFLTEFVKSEINKKPQ